MNLLVLGLAAATLAGSDAATLLDDKGLQRETTMWVLPAESELNRALRDARSLDR